MPFKKILGKRHAITIDEINLIETDRANESASQSRGGTLSLAGEFQTRLTRLGLLDPVFGGDAATPFGPLDRVSGIIDGDTRNALFEFCKISGIKYDDTSLTGTQLEAMDKAKPETFLPIEFDNKSTDDAHTRLAKRVLRYMRAKGWWIARSPEMYNIVYIEGMNSDGNLNSDAFDQWNDRRLVIQIQKGGKPLMVINDQATTEPGKFYTAHPLNPHGAARIAFGQYKAWMVGKHQGSQPALVQRGLLRVHRDLDKNGKRNSSDPIDVGDWFAINQHTTSQTVVPELVGKFSAGCLVGRRYNSHMTFLRELKKDVRYQLNNGYLFVSAVIPGDDLMRTQP